MAMNAPNTPALVANPPRAAFEEYWCADALVRILADGTQSAGTFDLVEISGGAGSAGAVAHAHLNCVELVVILEGEVEFVLDGKAVHLCPGDHLTVPRGIVHGFRNVGALPYRMLACYRPSGFVRYFRAIGTPRGAAPDAPPPVDDEMNTRALVAAEEVQMTFANPGHPF